MRQFQERSCWAIEQTRSFGRGIHFSWGRCIPVEALDEQKLLDQLRPPTASPEAPGQATPVILKIEDCQLDLAAHTFVDGNGREVQLTRAEIALLAEFVGSPRRVLSRDQLCRAAVGRGAGHDDRKYRHARRPAAAQDRAEPKAPRFHPFRAQGSDINSRYSRRPARIAMRCRLLT